MKQYQNINRKELFRSNDQLKRSYVELKRSNDEQLDSESDTLLLGQIARKVEQELVKEFASSTADMIHEPLNLKLVTITDVDILVNKCSVK